MTEPLNKINFVETDDRKFVNVNHIAMFDPYECQITTILPDVWGIWPHYINYKLLDCEKFKGFVKRNYITQKMCYNNYKMNSKEN